MLRHLRFAFGPRIFLAPDNGGGSGGQNLTLEQQLSAARNDLQTALDKGKSTETELADLRAERDKLKSQFDELVKTADKASADLKAARDQLVTVTGERDKAQKDFSTASGHVTRLEKLCEVKGQDHNAAPPVIDPPAIVSLADLNTRIAQAKTPAEVAAITEEARKAHSEHRLR